MKNIYIFIALLFIATSCDDFLDVNDNPNQSDVVQPKLLLMDVLTNESTMIMDLGPTMLCWTNHMGSGLSAKSFSVPEKYMGLDGQNNLNLWSTFFQDLKTIKLTKEICQENNNLNGMSQCDILSALIWYRTTMMYENLPFTQALDYDNYKYPEFDDQKFILLALIDMLDTAIDRIDVNEVGIDEIIYHGDIKKWKRFANYLKFKIYFILANKETEYAEKVEEMILSADLMISDENDFEFPFFDREGNKNPYYRLLESFSNGNSLFLFPGETHVNLSKKNKDPRKGYWYEAGRADKYGEYQGIKNGESVTTVHTLWTVPSGTDTLTFWSPNAPVVFGSYAEQNLLIAEAYLRGFCGEVSKSIPTAFLQEAVTSHMSKMGVRTTQINMYKKNIADFALYNNTDALQYLYEEMYITFTNRPLAAFSLIRRVNYPIIPLPIGAVTSSNIVRWPIPNYEVSTNPNAAKVKKGLTEKMWFQK